MGKRVTGYSRGGPRTPPWLLAPEQLPVLKEMIEAGVPELVMAYQLGVTEAHILAALKHYAMPHIGLIPKRRKQRFGTERRHRWWAAEDEALRRRRELGRLEAPPEGAWKELWAAAGSPFVPGSPPNGGTGAWRRRTPSKDERETLPVGCKENF